MDDNKVVRTKFVDSMADDDNDGLLVTFVSSGVHRTFVDEFTRELAFGENQFIVICDAVTGEKFNNVNTVGITSNIGAD